MGVLHSIPLCSRGTPATPVLDLDNNNNDAGLSPTTVHTSQPQVAVVPPPEATSTPRPQGSPTGLPNEQYSDSLASDDDPEDMGHPDEPPVLSDSGLDESATEFEFSRPGGPGPMDSTSGGQDEGVHEEFDDTLVLEGHEEIDLNDEDILERPPEPTVPDERVSSGGSSPDESSEDKTSSSEDNLEDMLALPADEVTDETTRKISTILSSLVGDRPSGEDFRPDFMPSRG